MRYMLTNSGQNIEVEGFEIEGYSSDGYDIWYYGKDKRVYHNLEFEYDLDEIKEIEKLVNEFLSKIPEGKRVRFLVSKDV